VRRSLQASIGFQSLHPFLNPSNLPADKVILGDYRTVVWPSPKENAVCAMFGAVHSCNLIHPGYFGSHHNRVISIIPTFDALYNFQMFLRKVYLSPDLYAPFDYGCILSFASRREGLTSPCLCLVVFSWGLLVNFSLSQFKQDTCPIKRPQAQYEAVWCIKGCSSSGFVVSEKLPPLP
jgi:hypothetical protein